MYNFIFTSTDSESVKQLKRNVVILMQNENLLQFLTEQNPQLLPESIWLRTGTRYNGLVDILKSINNTVHHENLRI